MNKKQTQRRALPPEELSKMNEAETREYWRRFGLKDKEQTAIERLIEASCTSERYYKKPLVITTSGGKDSSVVVELALRAGIDFELMHSHTTADAPETVQFIRSEFKRLEDMGFPSEKIIINYPVYKGRRTSMWSLIQQKLMPPTRTVRYCCEILKERGGQGRYISTGVRWAESIRRKNSRGIYETAPSDKSKKIVLNNDNDDRRQLFETCGLQRMAICNPIIDWTDDDIWQFIQDAKIPVNPLYQCGFSRVGCIGCPMAGKARYKEFARYPKYKDLYIHTFNRMLAARKEKGLDSRWGTAEDVYHWWMEDGVLPGQISMDGFEEKDWLEEYTKNHQDIISTDSIPVYDGEFGELL